MATRDPKNAAVKDQESGESSLGPYAEAFEWSPRAPRFRVAHLLLSWLLAGASVLIAAAVVPGVSVGSFGNAVAAAALIAVLNAVLPPIVAALRLPFTLALGFVSVLAVDALILLLVSDISPSAIHVASFGWALLAALVIAAAMVALEAVLGVNDEDTYSLRVIRRIARRQGPLPKTTGPGIVFLEIDGLALPVLQRAMRDGNAPELARWVSDGTHQLLEWETDLSSQTGASQAGILLGSNEDVPAFRWVEKESRKLVACSSPQACAEIEGRLASGEGLLVSGGASRGNLFSGGADAVILTVSRLSAEKRANPGYRPFLANGFNVTRLLVLVVWEVILERVAAIRQRRREVLPRGDRGGLYPFLRAAVCVGVRDLIVFGVLTDMMAGRPAVYATFSSYDEVAHHSGLERVDTLEALRKVDQQIGRINRARRFAPRPYKLVVLSDHGQTQGATFKQRNGYDLQDLVERSLGRATVDQLRGGDENDVALAHAVAEATGRRPTELAGDELGEGEAVVLASGNLALVYLMSATRRLSLEEIDHRYPGLLPSLRGHPDIGFLLVRSSEHGPVILGGRGTRYLAEDRLVGEDPLAPFPSSAADHLRRSDGFPHAPDVLLNSFYSPELERGCAFEELISFHGGLGGPQTRPFILHPVQLPTPAQPVVGAVSVHHLLSGWRQALQRDSTRLTAAEPAVSR